MRRREKCASDSKLRMLTLERNGTERGRSEFCAAHVDAVLQIPHGEGGGASIVTRVRLSVPPSVRRDYEEKLDTARAMRCNAGTAWRCRYDTDTCRTSLLLEWMNLPGRHVWGMGGAARALFESRRKPPATVTGRKDGRTGVCAMRIWGQRWQFEQDLNIIS